MRENTRASFFRLLTFTALTGFLIMTALEALLSLRAWLTGASANLFGG